MRFFIFLVLMVQSLVSTAQPNGCGSGWNVWIVPDSIPLANCTFGNSCNQHDSCYSICEKSTENLCLYRKCEPGGDLYRNDRCSTDINLIQSWISSRDRKNVCDQTFYEQMIASNSNKYVCKALAIVYRGAVKQWGAGSFSGVFALQAGSPAWKQSQESYNKAISDFFKEGTDEQFKNFVEADIKNINKIDLNSPLKFSPSSGLQNLEIR